ncbi:DegT/DnrJ/EryC1/StrS family aminotransferase [Streptomyces sp. NPDC059010]|uniref:DegT/DnrJ/EryC1/StrS family aminotransferase n=1 Tax=Streptomyces sp. NPDC059010 TaxID=3346695 RepID=UPI0036B81E4E
MTLSAEITRNARPYLHGPEFEAAAEAMRVGQYGHSETTERFEAELARYLGVPDVVAVASCTAALHLSLLVADVGPGDEVVVPSQTFCATIQAIISVGASPRFVEVSPRTSCVDGRAVGDALTPATRAVLPVLYGGRAVDLSAIRPVLQERRITVIEDAAHAFGSRTGDGPVGATGDLTCFSFGPIKNLTCVEGGAVVPRNPDEADALRELRTLGITQSQAERIRTTTYDVARHGLRATLSAVHAAVGIVQLQQFPAVAWRRQELWRAYAAGLARIGVDVVDVDIDRTVPFNCVVRIPQRDQVHAILTSMGVGAGVHYPPNHLQPAFAPWRRSLPATEQLGREILSLPFHPAMTTTDAADVVSLLDGALEEVR